MRRTHGRRCGGLGEGGFTLLELTIVIAILSIMIGISIPSFTDSDRRELQSQGRRLTVMFRLLRSEAILHEASYRLNYDLDAERYWVTSDDPRSNPAQIINELGVLARETTMPSAIQIGDVGLPEYNAKVNQGMAYTVFYPDGNIDKTVIHLGTETDSVTLYVDPMSNRLLMSPGYHEVPYS